MTRTSLSIVECGRVYCKSLLVLMTFVLVHLPGHVEKIKIIGRLWIWVIHPRWVVLAWNV